MATQHLEQFSSVKPFLITTQHDTNFSIWVLTLVLQCYKSKIVNIPEMTSALRYWGYIPEQEKNRFISVSWPYQNLTMKCWTLHWTACVFIWLFWPVECQCQSLTDHIYILSVWWQSSTVLYSVHTHNGFSGAVFSTRLRQPSWVVYVELQNVTFCSYLNSICLNLCPSDTFPLLYLVCVSVCVPACVCDACVLVSEEWVNPGVQRRRGAAGDPLSLGSCPN